MIQEDNQRLKYLKSQVRNYFKKEFSVLFKDAEMSSKLGTEKGLLVLKLISSA